MKAYFFFILLLVILISCNSKNKSTQNNEQNDSLKISRNETRFINKEIIFSTSDIDSSKILSLDEIRKVMKLNEGRNSEYDDGYIKLPQYKCFDIVIYYVNADFDNVYSLCIYKAGELYDYLSVSPYFKDPDTSSNYCVKRYFEIYKDYTIKLTTETSDVGNMTKTTKYYHINDKGKFYEVKE